MGRAQGSQSSDEGAARRRRRGLPTEVTDAIPTDVQKAWVTIAALLPDGAYLAGGTAAALRLHHRQSQDLDFFYHDDALDLDALADSLIGAGAAITERAPGTLKVLIGQTKVEFLHADQARPQRRLAQPEIVAGLPVASAKDLMAMKLKVLAERGELRDYYDVKELDDQSVVRLEEGIQHWMARYDVDRTSNALQRLIVSLGYLDDVEDDAAVPMSKSDLAAWWKARQARLLKTLKL